MKYRIRDQHGIIIGRHDNEIQALEEMIALVVGLERRNLFSIEAEGKTIAKAHLTAEVERIEPASADSGNAKDRKTD